MTVNTSVGLLEDTAEELMALEPEVVESVGAQIEFPHKENARLSNFIRFHHPDGTHSDLAAPTFNPQRPSPYRRKFLQHWLAKPKEGQRWYFLKRQAPPPELPLRCFVEPGGMPCSRRVGNLADLYMHVVGKHGEEAKMYADVLEAMKLKMQANLSPEVLEALSMAKPVEAPAAPSEVFSCTYDGCSRFFDKESGRNQHEYTCPHRPEKEG